MKTYLSIFVQKIIGGIFVLCFLWFICQPVVVAGEILANLKPVLIPQLKDKDTFHTEIRGSLEQFNKFVRLIQKEDFIQLAEHPVFAVTNIGHSRLQIHFVFDHKKPHQLYCFRRMGGYFKLFEPTEEELDYNAGFLIYYSKDGLPERYFEGEFQDVVDHVRPKMINFVKGIEINFHSNGYPSEYRKIENYRPKGQRIKWDTKGIIVSENIADGTEIVPEFEQVLKNDDRVWITKDNKFRVYGKFVSHDGDIVTIKKRFEEKNTTIEFSELKEFDQQRIKDLIKLEKK
jgi:hypothetical protein